MAKGKKTGGRDFTEGISGNPKGRPPLTPEQKELRKISKNMIEELYNKLLLVPAEELAEIAKDKTRQGIELLVARVIIDGITKSDRSAFNILVDRLIGKISDQVEHSFPKPVIVEMHDGERIVMGVKNETE